MEVRTLSMRGILTIACELVFALNFGPWVATAMIQQFLSEVVWGQLDYLIIDTPPGTYVVDST
jgi:hypothetical protein